MPERVTFIIDKIMKEAGLRIKSSVGGRLYGPIQGIRYFFNDPAVRTQMKELRAVIDTAPDGSDEITSADVTSLQKAVDEFDNRLRKVNLGKMVDELESKMKTILKGKGLIGW